MTQIPINKLKQLLIAQPDLELAVLVGSHAVGNARADSDIDIAIRWHKHITPLQSLAKTETLRQLIAKHTHQTETKIDLIDIMATSLAMRAVIVEEGMVLKGEGDLAWNHFLQRTWRELESYYWNDIYAT
jgi:predicted nucleotidyltransferase